MLPAGSVNQAMNGPPPRTTPFSSASNPGWPWKTTPRRVSSSTVASMFSTWKLRLEVEDGEGRGGVLVLLGMRSPPHRRPGAGATGRS